MRREEGKRGREKKRRREEEGGRKRVKFVIVSFKVENT